MEKCIEKNDAIVYNKKCLNLRCTEGVRTGVNLDIKKKYMIMACVIFIGVAGAFYYMEQRTELVEPVLESSDNMESDTVSSVETEQTDVKAVMQETESVTMEETVISEETDIYIHICGQVKNPGVYKMKVHDRVAALIKEAGGFTKEAAGEWINQADWLTDGQQIYIPSKDEVDGIPGKDAYNPVSGLETEEGTSSSKVNLNTASKEELMTLPGIGESKADAIIKYREECGGFQSVEDIMQINGIKDGVFEKIADNITVLQ